MKQTPFRKLKTHEERMAALEKALDDLKKVKNKWFSDEPLTDEQKEKMKKMVETKLSTMNSWSKRIKRSDIER